MKPVLLDAFCGAGGATRGYQNAGFYVVGVDIKPQPNYCGDRFIEADALDFLSGGYGFLPEQGWDAIHASPPCPIHSSLNGWSGETDSPNLIPQTREYLKATGLPYVIENVPGAPLESPIRLCGASFGLGVEIEGEWRELRRHRMFETNFPMMASPCHHTGPPVIVVGGSIGRRVFDPRRRAIAPTFEQAKAAMDMPWAKRRQEVINAIPPAYAEHIGHYLTRHLQAVKEAA